jgi:hypothetical protein
MPPADRQAIPRSAATVRCRGNVRSDLAAGTRAALRSHRPPRVLLERLLEASVLSRRPKLLHVLKLKLKLKFVMTITSVRGPAARTVRAAFDLSDASCWRGMYFKIRGNIFLLV